PRRGTSLRRELQPQAASSAHHHFCAAGHPGRGPESPTRVARALRLARRGENRDAGGDRCAAGLLDHARRADSRPVAGAAVTPAEGGTPLLAATRLGARHGFADLWVKEEGVNPTGSFKARGLAAAVSRATLAGARRFVVPTAGNAGVALAVYAARAAVAARVDAPASTPPT